MQMVECSAFIAPSAEGHVVILARNSQDARLAANAKTIYRALRLLIDVIKAGDERSIAAARQAAEKILEEIGEKVD